MSNFIFDDFRKQTCMILRKQLAVHINSRQFPPVGRFVHGSFCNKNCNTPPKSDHWLSFNFVKIKPVSDESKKTETQQYIQGQSGH